MSTFNRDLKPRRPKKSDKNAAQTAAILCFLIIMFAWIALSLPDALDHVLGIRG